MKLSARNQLKGKVVEIKPGAVNGVVTLELPCGQQIVASITMDSINSLGLKPGVQATAIIKATSVMLGVE